MGRETIGRGRALVVLAAAAGHLGLVIILGAIRVDLRVLGPVAGAIASYGVLSGADSGYSFFAPGVGSPPVATFEVVDAAGAMIKDHLESGDNAEADLRAGNVVGRFWLEQDQALKRSIAASWAGKMFARHPGAQSVAVRVEQCELAPMHVYRPEDGLRCALHYQAKFVPHAKLLAAPIAGRRAP
ncbi:hypothetical protein SOCE26_029910 [Sorangium cellulosum]|uniref:Uncharacterized protein n=1 Tax=Sorangium cellulosum TaxID=56 RepID=A0A2L0EQM3_SORCE|nr:hypothetical protein [Sorangium cellulosum]AUX41570.1 hypothetical protein SOCE26_029910 [Sorangium cellulosum]